MAYLNSTLSRPACIVSNIPPRFCDLLERELDGAVAISSCPVKNLETMVKLRGASIAVVGAAQGGMEVAERLSHDLHSLKVYLVHQAETAVGSTFLNGFAGIFDLQTESQRLSAAIKRDLEPAQGVTASQPRRDPPGKNPLSTFLSLQKRLSNRTVMFEMMLDAFLEIGDADEGLLLLPGEPTSSFKIISSRGENLSGRENFTLSPRSIAALKNGELILEHDLWEITKNFSAPSASCLVAPVLLENELRAILIADRGDSGDAMDAFLMGAAALIQQSDRLEKRNAFERSLDHVRQIVSPAWMLVDSDHKVVHREGNWPQELKTHKSRLSQPRLKDAVARAQKGETGSVRLFSHEIAYQRAPFEKRDCALLKLGPVPETSFLPRTVRSKIDDFLAIARENFSVPLPELESAKALLSDQKSAPVGETRINLTAALLTLQVELAASPNELSDEMIPCVVVFALAVKWTFNAPVSIRYVTLAGTAYLTFELVEAALPAHSVEWTQEPLIQRALHTLEVSPEKMRTGPFGFQIERPLAPSYIGAP